MGGNMNSDAVTLPTHSRTHSLTHTLSLSTHILSPYTQMLQTEVMGGNMSGDALIQLTFTAIPALPAL